MEYIIRLIFSAFPSFYFNNYHHQVMPFSVNAQLVWIGASDFIEEGKFVWITGETVDGMTSSSSTSSNCLSVSRYGYDDEYCSGLYQPMCQIMIE